MKNKIFLILAAIFIVSSCGENDSKELSEDELVVLKLEDNAWKLNMYGYEMDSKMAVLPTSNYMLVFSGEGSFSGSLDCNKMGGSYTVVDNEITFSQIASTRMACLGSKAETYQSEHSFVTNVLGAAQSYSISNDQLTITASDSSQLIFTNIDP